MNSVRRNENHFSSTGDVTERMDKVIGRLVFRIKGSVSANNYISFDNLSLTGKYVYLQYCLLKPLIATIHLEILSIDSVPYRLSFSTLYDTEKPKYLGRSFR